MELLVASLREVCWHFRIMEKSMEYLDTTGRIFDVQRYSIHDGPGIRTIVFLKGCVLRCQWCCNPESQEYKIQTMKTPDGVKTMGRDVTVREMIELVEKDRPYYYRSGGGMTLSGGECLCQPEFARDLLPAVEAMRLPEAVLTLVDAIYDFADDKLDRELIDIARDGVISEDERPQFEKIITKIKDIITAAMAVSCARTKEG